MNVIYKYLESIKMKLMWTIENRSVSLKNSNGEPKFVAEIEGKWWSQNL